MVRDNGAERIGHAVASGERREVTTNREIPTRHCSRKGAPGGDGGRARVQCRTKGGRPLWTSERVAAGTIRRRETKATAAFPFPIASINLCVRMRAEPEEAPWRRLQIPLRGRNSAAAPPPAYLVPLRKLPACTRVYFCLWGSGKGGKKKDAGPEGSAGGSVRCSVGETPGPMRKRG
ncbi:hypothetical protein HPB48_019379 [Haemaphysalis longicornis]|uniref:Uncharacterized protein n=1 Tax=Haemaphysalis longicornis TaxID=44386 RepID=A0A9J6G3U2_HAELO|nr:hypothetical protein HPB48_019379 [Haemaphysalis longicornis]